MPDGRDIPPVPSNQPVNPQPAPLPPRPGGRQPQGLRGSVIPNVEFPGGGVVDKRIIIPVLGPLEKAQADTILAWKFKNRLHDVQVWYDPDAILMEEVLRFVIWEAKLRTQPKTIGREHTSRKTDLREPDNIELTKQEVFEAKQSAFGEIESYHREGKSWTEAIKVWFSQKRHGTWARYVPTEQALEDIITAQKELRAYLEQGVDNVGATLHNIREEAIPPGFSFDELYRDYAFKWGSLQDGENLLRGRLVYEKEGIGIDKRRQPELNDELFAGIRQKVSKAGWQLVQLAIEKKAMDDWHTREPEKFAHWADASADYPDYDAFIEEKLQKPGIVSDIDKIIAENPAGAAFKSLEEITTGSEGILIGGLDGRTAVRPMALAAKKGCPVLQQYLEGCQITNNLIRDDYIKWQRRVQEVKDFYYNEWKDRLPTEEELRNFHGDLRLAKEKLFDNKANVVAKDRSSPRDYLKAVNSLPYAGMENGDLGGHLTGTPALLDSYRPPRSGSAESVPNFTGSTALTAEMTIHGSPKIFTFDGDFAYIPIKGSKGVVIVQLSNDEQITTFANSLFARHDSRTTVTDIKNTPEKPNLSWWLWDGSKRELNLYAGYEFTAGPDDQVFLLAHGIENKKGVVTTVGDRYNAVGKTLLKGKGQSDVEVVDILDQKKILGPEFKEMELVICKACSKGVKEGWRAGETHSVEVDPDGGGAEDFIGGLAYALEDKDHQFGKLIGSSEFVVTGGYGDRYIYKENDAHGNPVRPVLEHKQNGNYYEYQRTGTKGVYKVKVSEKSTNSKGEYYYDSSLENRALSSDSKQVPINSLNSELNTPEPVASPEENEALIDQLHNGLKSGDALVPPDTNALLLGMRDTEGNHRIHVADSDILSVAGIQRATELAEESRDAEEWIAKLANLDETASQAVNGVLQENGSPDADFETLKSRVSDDGYSFHTVDPATPEGAAFINQGESFSVIQKGAIGGACAGPRVRRSACSPEEIEEQANDAVSGLTLLSDEKTQFLIDDGFKDIALHDTITDPVLEKVKQGLHTFRRNIAAQRLRDHEGYHNVIALDEDSLPVARQLAESSGEKGRALLLHRDEQGNHVLLDEGRVVVMVEGGARNRMTLVGNKSTLDEFSGAELAEQVKAFAREGTVGSVTVQPILETPEEAEAFNAADTFKKLEVLEVHGKDSPSPWKDATGYVRLHPLKPDDMGELVESDVLRVGVPGKPGGMELDNGYLKTALDLHDKQPGAFEAGLRDRLAAIRAKAASSESKTFKSLSLDYARKVQELHAEVSVFRAAMDQVYADHAPGSGSVVTLSPDDMPLLSSLTQDDGVWKMTFSNQDADSDSYRTLTIDDERIVDFIHGYSDKIDKVRNALDVDLNREAFSERMEELEMIDGMGLAMALQSIIEQVGHHKEKVNDGAPLPASYKRALQVHQVVGFAFGARASLGTLLDVAKYAVALKTGKVVSLPERLSSKVASLSEEVEGALGSTLRLSADSLKLIGPIFDGALTFASIGLDIAEIITSPTKEGKELAGLQLGLDTSLAAVTFTGLGIGTFGVAAGLTEVAAATISGSVGAITVPLAGLAIGVEALAQNFIVIEKLFDASMSFWEGVYQDLILSDAFDKGHGVLNLASRTLKDKNGNLILDNNYQPQHTGRLAPISHIDFRTGKITYGNIYVPKVTGGRGNPITGYFLDGPDEWSDNGNINLVDNSNCRVRKYLEQGRHLPLDGLKAVILPARNDWTVRTDNNWVKQNPPGAVTWYLRHKDNHGYWLLKSREHKRCGGKSATGDFASSFWVAFIIIPTEWGMSLYFDSEHPYDFLKNNFQFDGHGKPTVSALMPAHNLTVVAPTHEVYYNLTGTDGYSFYLSLPKNGTVDIHSSGQDNWVVSSPHLKHQPNGMPNIHLNWTTSSHLMTWPGNHLALHNLHTNLTLLNPDEKTQYYIFDPVANKTSILVDNNAPVNPNDFSESTVLENEYRHPGSTVNKVSRFHPYGTHGDWLDLAPPNHPNGTDLYMPDYFEGTIRKDQVFKSGLVGEFYDLSSHNLKGATSFDTAKGWMNRPADDVFLANRLEYSTYFSENSVLQKNVNTLGRFLKGTYHEGATGLKGKFGLNAVHNAVGFRFTGLIHLEAGRHDFKIGSSACVHSTINDRVLVGGNCNFLDFEFPEPYGHFIASASALYDIELYYIEYWVANEPSTLDVQIKKEGEQDYQALTAFRLYHDHSQENKLTKLDEQILEHGLAAEFFDFTGRGIVVTGLDSARKRMNGTADATFIAADMDYSTQYDDAPHSGIPFSRNTLGEFLRGWPYSRANKYSVAVREGLDLNTELHDIGFHFSGLVWLEKGMRTFPIQSSGCYQLTVNGHLIHRYENCFGGAGGGTWPLSSPIRGQHISITEAAFYSIELEYAERWTSLPPAILKVYLEDRSGHSQVLADDVLFNDQHSTGVSPKLSKDTRPIAGWPDFGYMFYSNSTQSFFYRQPITSTNKADAHILKLPREYSGANFNPNSNLTAYHPQPLVLTSSGHVQYLLTISKNHTEPITHQPTLTPLEMIWKTVDYYKSAVLEILSEAFPHNDIIPAAVLPDNKNATQPCTYGFFDPGGSEGKGRVAVLDPGDHDEVQLKYAEVSSKAYNDGQLLNQTRCFDIDTHTNSSEALGYQPVHVVRNGANDFYIAFLQSQNQLYLANTTSGSTNSLQSSELVPLDLLLHNDTVNVTHAYMNSNRDGLVATTAHGLILDITDAALRNSTEIQSNPCIMLHDAVGNEYKIIGFIKGELEGWNLDAMAMEQRIIDELARYPKSVTQASNLVLPIQRLPPAFGEYNEHAFNQSEAYHAAGCPGQEHSWFIQPIERIYGYPGNLTALGFDLLTSLFYGYDDNKKVVTVKLSPFDANKTEASCPKPVRFNPHQPDYKYLAYQNSVVYGTDDKGRTFMVGRAGQTLVGLDLRNETFVADPNANQTRVALVKLATNFESLLTEKFSNVSRLTDYLQPFIPALLEGVTNQTNTSIAPRLFLQLSKDFSDYQAWYVPDKNNTNATTAEEGVYAFKGSEEVSFLGTTLGYLYDTVADNINWFFSSLTGTLYRQDGDNQTGAGRYGEVRALGEDSSLIIVGTEDSDTLDSDLLLLGQPSDKNVLYMQGRNGKDEYHIGEKGLQHYGAIVADTSVVQLQGFNQSNTTDNPDDTSQFTTELLASDFAAALGNESLILIHSPSGHYVELPGVYQWSAVNGSLANATNATDVFNVTNQTNGGLENSYRWRSKPLTLEFTGLVTSLKELLGNLFRQALDSLWYLPVELDSLPEGSELTLSADHLTLVKAGLNDLHSHERDNTTLTLHFSDNSTDTNRSLIIRDYTLSLGKADSLWVSNNSTGDNYVPLQYAHRRNPAEGFDTWSVLREEFGYEDKGKLAVMSITPRGHGWTLSAEQLQFGNLTEPLQEQLANSHRVTVVNPDPKASPDPVYGYQTFDWREGANATAGCFVIHRPVDNLFLLFDELPYQALSGHPTSENLFQNPEHEPDYRIDLKNNGTDECVVVFRGVPAGLLFTYQPQLGGWPIANGEAFLASQGHSWSPGPPWLLPENYPALKVGERTARSAGHPVFYNVSPEQLSVTRHADGRGWNISSGDILMRQIETPEPTDFFTMTLVDRTLEFEGLYPATYLVLNYPFSELHLQTNNDRKIPYTLTTVHPDEVSIQLSVVDDSGFPTEVEFVRQMLVNSLGRYDGVQFTDGLQSRYDFVDWLASNPFTIVPTVSTGTYTWSATGNSFNNICPVKLDSFGEYNITTGKGNDFITVDDRFWSAKASFPVRWSTVSDIDTPATATTPEALTPTPENGEHTETTDTPLPVIQPRFRRSDDSSDQSLTTLNIQADPIRTPPPPKGYVVNINPGPGDDLVDLTTSAETRIIESEDKDTVILSPFSNADLTALRNGILFLKNLKTTDVQPIAYAPELNEILPGTSLLPVVQNIDFLNSEPAGARELPVIEAWLWSSASGQYIAKFPREISECISEIHFADGKQTTDTLGWFSGLNPTVEDYESTYEDVDGSGEYDSGSASGSGSGDDKPELRDKGVVGVTEDTLEDAYTYALISRDEPVAEGNPAFNNLDQTLERLIQEMSTFRARREDGVSPSLTSVMPSPTSTLASPTHMPSVMPTPTPLAMG